ncbi:MAG TPA: DNA polymerase III subunit gamma/tau [Abditibacteriaceae bacterium]|jgi:DNA polymerase-3 subunit gamma/tau
MSLYRKYRPQTFEDMVGQEHIAQTLRNALAAQPVRIAHAYLFCGPRGTGKTTTARLLAKCLNCVNGPTSTPCNECDFCTRVRDNQATMDLIEIDAASNTGVDNVREVIIDKVNVAPAQGRYRIYIIDEVHMLSTSSFNALLKTLEEPPPHAIFVLATTDAHKVPPTISSRCQRFDFRRVGPNDIVKRLQHVAGHESIDLRDEAARLIAFTADGALRDALTLLEQVTAFSAEEINESDVRLVLGTVSRELLWDLMDGIAARDPAAGLTAIERATEEGVSFSQLTRDLVSYSRDLLLLTVGFEGESGLSDTEKKRRHAHANAIGRARLTDLVEALRAAEKEMRQSTDHRLLLELTLVRQSSESQQPREMPGRAVDGALSPREATPPQRVAAPQASTQANGQMLRPEPLRAQPSRPQPLEMEPASPLAPMREQVAQTREHADAVTNGVTDAPITPIDMVPPLVGNVLHEEAPPVVNTGPSIETSTPAEVAAPTSDESAAVAESAASTQPEVGNGELQQNAPANGGTPRKGRRIHSLEEFHELWPFVLARVKKKIGVSAVAYLHDARPISLDEREATLEFQREFHYEKACEAARRLPFEQIINECLASPHRLRFQLAPPKAKPVAAPAAPPPDDDDDDEDDVLRLAQDMFGAEVVGRSGEG